MNAGLAAEKSRGQPRLRVRSGRLGHLPGTPRTPGSLLPVPSGHAERLDTDEAAGVFPATGGCVSVAASLGCWRSRVPVLIFDRKTSLGCCHAADPLRLQSARESPLPRSASSAHALGTPGSQNSIFGVSGFRSSVSCCLTFGRTSPRCGRSSWKP